MKKSFLTFLAGLVCAALPAAAQIPGDLHVGGGWTVPTGQMDGRYNTGGNFVIGGGFHFLPHLELQAEYMYNTFGLQRSYIEQNGASDGRSHVNSITVDPLVRVGIPGTRFGVYGTGGLGYYRRTLVFEEPNFDLHNGAFGYNIGGGVTYKLAGPLSAYFEVRYHHAVTGRGDTQMVPVTLGVRF